MTYQHDPLLLKLVRDRSAQEYLTQLCSEMGLELEDPQSESPDYDEWLRQELQSAIARAADARTKRGELIDISGTVRVAEREGHMAAWEEYAKLAEAIKEEPPLIETKPKSATQEERAQLWVSVVNIIKCQTMLDIDREKSLLGDDKQKIEKELKDAIKKTLPLLSAIKITQGLKAHLQDAGQEGNRQAYQAYAEYRCYERPLTLGNYVARALAASGKQSPHR